jgi:protein-disulfide isomerase
MPSGKKSKQMRRAAAPPPVVSKGGTRRRQADPKILAIGGGIALVVVIAIVLGIVLTGGSGSSSALPKGTPAVGNCQAAGLPGCDEVKTLFHGIPQDGLYLGSKLAPAQMVMFIDLQCPFCQQYETSVMPDIIKKYVRTGKLRVKVEPWAFIGEDSNRGQAAMFAAAKQNKAWNFAEILYLNQRTENTGWLDDAMVAQAAASIDGLNVRQLMRDRNDGNVKSEASRVADLAQVKQVTGTPTVFVGRNGTTPKLVGANGSVPDLEQTKAAIEAAIS